MSGGGFVECAKGGPPAIYPWTVEKGTLTVLHLKNTTNKTVAAGVLIRFDGGVYNPDKFELQPYQTIDLDIQKLKDSKKPDVLGHVFPASAAHGQLAWFQITPYTMIGRAEGTDVGAGIARSFSCQSDCCGNFWQGYNLFPEPMNGLVGGSAAFSATETYTDCFGTTTFYPGKESSATSWYSGNTSVVTVNSSGHASFTGPGLTTGDAVFPVTTYKYNPYPECTEGTGTNTAVGTVNVNPPDHVIVLNDLNGPPSLCPTKPWVRQMTMQLADVNNHPVTVNYGTAESFSPAAPTNTCPPHVSPKPSACGFTATNYCPTCTGAWTDTLDVQGTNYCGTTIPQTPSCGFSETSTWSMCYYGLTNSVWTSARQTLSNGITVSGNSTQFSTGTVFH